VGEVQASDGGDLQAAQFHPVVAAVAGTVGDGDLAPGEAGELVVEGGLVGLDDQQVGGVLLGALRHQAWIAASQSCGPVSLPADAAVQQQP
jgi:hypothetical protein